jgi:hypothetical protein
MENKFTKLLKLIMPGAMSGVAVVLMVKYAELHLVIIYSVSLFFILS